MRACPPENLEGMRWLLGPFMGRYDASRRPHDIVSKSTISAIASYNTGFGFPTFTIISQATSDEAARLQSFGWKNGKLLEGSSEEFFTLFTATSQVSTCHMCALGPCVGLR